MPTISLPAKLYAGTLTTTTSATLGSIVPAGETDVVTSIVVSNITDVAVQATLSMGGVVFFKNLDLAPRQVTVLDMKQVLNAGDAIQGGASAASSVNMFISGVKITN